VQEEMCVLVEQGEEAAAWCVGAVHHDDWHLIEVHRKSAHLGGLDLAARGCEHQDAGRFERRHPVVEMVIDGRGAHR
jgi:hypothetical protein